MIRKNKWLVVALATIAALGLGGTLAAVLADSQNQLQEVSASVSAWDGTTKTAYTTNTVTYNGATYYPISTAEELAYIATDSASWNKNFLLTSDIDLGGKSWTPIAFNNSVKGSTTNALTSAFSGIFDFNGHTINNLALNTNLIGKAATFTMGTEGLFGYNTGTIKNLNLASTVLNVTSSVSYSYVGAVCGYNAGTIESVSLSNFNGTFTFASLNNGTIWGSWALEGHYAALVGYNTGTVKNAMYLSGTSACNNTQGSNWLFGSVPATTDVATGTVYDGNSGTVENVYVAPTVTSTASTTVTNNTTGTTGDLSGTQEEAAQAINDAIAAEGSGESGLKVDPETGTFTNATTEPAQSIDYLAGFILLDSCTDYDKIDSYLTAYATDAAVKADFDAYVFSDPNGDYTATQKLFYMKALRDSHVSGSGLNKVLASKNTTNEATLLVSLGSLALVSLGVFLVIKRKNA